MAKPYQHHDPILDKGKAIPHPKEPTRHTFRGRNQHVFGRILADPVAVTNMREKHKSGIYRGDSFMQAAALMFAAIIGRARRGR